MDPPSPTSADYDCYLRHEAHMWELDCLAEKELRQEQIQEDFGLEIDVGTLVDRHNAWFNMDGSPLLRPDDDDLPVPDLRSGAIETNKLGLDKNYDGPSFFEAGDGYLFVHRFFAGIFAGSHPRTFITMHFESPFLSVSSRESTPELCAPIRTRQREKRRPAALKQSPPIRKKSSASKPFSQKSSELPPGASWDASGMARCGLDNCTQKCSTSADLRRHRDSLAHCAQKKYACPGCPMRFTREDALKRHLHLTIGRRGADAARCRDPKMTALRDEFLGTDAAREAQREGKPDRVLVELYDTFLEATNADVL
ncbi:hypothetical protein K438DRAFT_1960507 [Mycena galopus ATCC 62051]|nr:hypothetical protein K438DRAFT_1960507 [Mycena galopus ATCC 62051]